MREKNWDKIVSILAFANNRNVEGMDSFGAHGQLRYDLICFAYYECNLDVSDIMTLPYVGCEHLAESTVKNYINKGNKDIDKTLAYRYCPAMQFIIHDTKQREQEKMRKALEKKAKEEELERFGRWLLAQKKEDAKKAMNALTETPNHEAYLLAMFNKYGVFQCLKIGEAHSAKNRLNGVTNDQRKQFPSNPFTPILLKSFPCEDKTQGLLFEAGLRKALKDMGGYHHPNNPRSTDYVYGVDCSQETIDKLTQVIELLSQIKL